MPRELSPEQRKAHLVRCQKAANENGGECLAAEYVNSSTPLPWRCAKGHEWKAAPRNVLHYSWCPTCYSERRGKKAQG